MKWKTEPSSGPKKIFALLILILLAAAHLPFISADPDIEISFSRGPFTDEGLNTIQVRNWVNHGALDVSECDNLLKTPLLGFPLAFTYSVFGASLEVSRIHMLVMLMLALMLAMSDLKHRGIIMILAGVSLLHYPVFHFSHYSLAEIPAALSILLSILFFARSVDPLKEKRAALKEALLSAVFASLAWCFKIQYIYVIPLIPLAYTFILSGKRRGFGSRLTKQAFVASIVQLAFLLAYFLAWYLPNRSWYEHMMANQSGTFGITEKTFEHIRFNLGEYILDDKTIWLTMGFLFCLTAGIAFYRSFSLRNRALFSATLIWFALELHKLTMVYLPTRYRVSLYVSMGLAVSIVLHHLLTLKSTRLKPSWTAWLLKGAAFSGVVALLVINTSGYFQALERRSYVIRQANEYVAHIAGPGDVVIGAWAPTLTWKSKSLAKPVWNHFLNYKDPIQTFQPKMIISEPDERDSESAYSSQGIVLDSLDTGARTFRIGQWDVKAFRTR
jgi:hypothetical protein